MVPHHPQLNPGADFSELTPEVILSEVETAWQVPLSGVILPLPSYINRVYELETRSRERIIVKFYRPGRWSRLAILEEHLFTLDCAAADLPVVPPLRFPDGGTLKSTANGIHFAIFPKRRGRAFEINSDHDFIRLGTLLARLHLVGSSRPARFRPILTPEHSTLPQIQHLLSGNFIGPALFHDAQSIFSELGAAIREHFHPDEIIRIHGDCHCGNVLNHPDSGLMLIDFDDMASGPPIQDWWLLLPGHAPDCQRELDLILQGYTTLRDFNPRQFDQIEVLRAMRYFYFLDWCARQKNDFNFSDRYPEWGSDPFWRRELSSLRTQLTFFSP